MTNDVDIAVRIDMPRLISILRAQPWSGAPVPSCPSFRADERDSLSHNNTDQHASKSSQRLEMHLQSALILSLEIIT